MKDVKIFRSSEIESLQLVGAGSFKGGWMKRIIYPENVVTKRTFFGLAEVNPGYSPHRWHTHTADIAGGYEVVYPKDFEEIYYIISGSGIVQWNSEDGKTHEEKVNASDTIFFPTGVAKHQLLNNGTEKIVMVFCGSPTSKVTLTK
jgi:mannose-6-phosphate isomerase-like protein (cupin superfamily)